MSQYPVAADLRRWASPAPVVKRPIKWRAEAFVVVLVAAYSTLLGAAMGLIWPRVAPHIDAINAYYHGSVAANKALLGDDVWFGFLGLLTGFVCVGVLRLLSGELSRGPGAVIGLAAGGIVGSLVAAHVGTAVQQPHLVASVHAQMANVKPTDIKRILYFFNFKLRANEVLLVWPVTAVALVAINVIVRYLRYPDE
jgi:hypothetical protein